jgi:flagellar hook-associated protein 3 FlgL
MNLTADNEIRPFLDALIDIRDALNSNNTTDLRSALGVLETTVDGIDKLRTSNGARQRQVSSASEYLEKTQIELSSLLSQNDDANMAETISLMRNQEITYQAVLEVGSRAISALNLFEYLR